MPKSFRFETSEVRIRRHGSTVILDPVAQDWAWLDQVVGRGRSVAHRFVHTPFQPASRRWFDGAIEIGQPLCNRFNCRCHLPLFVAPICLAASASQHARSGRDDWPVCDDHGFCRIDSSALSLAWTMLSAAPKAANVPTRTPDGFRARSFCHCLGSVPRVGHGRLDRRRATAR